jgi:hypothetical protein
VRAPVPPSLSHTQTEMIGVLALQGAFLEHLAAFAALGVEAKEVRWLFVAT